MEVLIFQKEAFEEMAAKFNSFSNRVNELLAKQGCKSLNRWLDNQEVCQQLNISPRARFIFHSIGNSFLGILKSLLHQEVLSGHLTPVCHVPVFSLGGSCWFNPSFSPISTLYIDWSSLPSGAEGIQTALQQYASGLSLTPEKVTTLQDNLNSLIPGFVPLLLTLLCMWLLKKNVSPIVIIIALFIVGIAGHVVGLL